MTLSSPVVRKPEPRRFHDHRVELKYVICTAPRFYGRCECIGTKTARGLSPLGFFEAEAHVVGSRYAPSRLTPIYRPPLEVPIRKPADTRSPAET